MISKILKLIIFLLIVAALIFGAVTLLKKRKAEEATTPIAKEYAVVISTIKTKKSTVKLSIPSIALSQNDNDTQIASKITARVLQMPKSGDRVKKGDLIIKLDDTTIKTSLQSVKDSLISTKANLNAAKLNLENLIKIHQHSQELLKVKGIAKEQFDAEVVKIDSAKARVASLEAQIAKLNSQIKSLENQLSYTQIISPTTGIVSKTFASIGDLAVMGKPLVKISADRGTWLLVRLPGSAKEIEFKGKIYPLKPLHSTFNGLNEFRADIDDYIPAGNRVETQVITFNSQAVLVPFDTLLNREGVNYIFEYKNGKVTPIKAPIIATGEQGVALRDSMADKELVEAKPDILLRLLGGYPVVKAPKE